MKKDKMEQFVRSAFPQQTFETAKARFREFYTGETDKLQAAEKAFRNLVALLLQGEDFPAPKVTSRIKDWNECIRKFDGKYRQELEQIGTDYEIRDHISDLIGLRVVCIYESNIEEVARLLRTHFEVVDETNKTQQMENIENGFGYKGLHLDLRLNSKRRALPEYSAFGSYRFEVQIRTIVQDAWSEVDHKLKYKRQTPLPLRRRIVRLAALFELADQEFEAIKNLSVELEKAALDQGTKLDEDLQLDLFGFLRVAKDLFPSSVFQGEALEGLLDDIEAAKQHTTIADFRNALSSNLPKVREYADYMKQLGHNMSAFTMIRHALYLSRPTVFDGMIFENHRKNFDRWLEFGTVKLGEAEEKKLQKKL